MLGQFRRAYRILRREGSVQLMGSIKASLNWRIRMWRRKARKVPQYWYRLLHRDAFADPYTIITVSPERINYIVVPHFQEELLSDGTYIIGGDWDQTVADLELNFFNEFEDLSGERKLIPVENYSFYRSVENHIQNGLPWHETEFYNWAMTFDDFPDKILYDKKDTFEWRFEQLDQLARSMREEGYKSQRECDSSSIVSGEKYVGSTVSKGIGSDEVPPEYHEVVVNIGRDGTLVFEEGRHRFVIARALRIESIPVRVLVRHSEWQKKRNEVADASSVSELTEETKQHLSHPDMQDLHTF